METDFRYYNWEFDTEDMYDFYLFRTNSSDFISDEYIEEIDEADYEEDVDMH